MLIDARIVRDDGWIDGDVTALSKTVAVTYARTFHDGDASGKGRIEAHDGLSARTSWINPTPIEFRRLCRNEWVVGRQEAPGSQHAALSTVSPLSVGYRCWPRR